MFGVAGECATSTERLVVRMGEYAEQAAASQWRTVIEPARLDMCRVSDHVTTVYGLAGPFWIVDAPEIPPLHRCPRYLAPMSRSRSSRYVMNYRNVVPLGAI
jgi:hypothetical protein